MISFEIEQKKIIQKTIYKNNLKIINKNEYRRQNTGSLRH